jgi:hypothetical protein
LELEELQVHLKELQEQIQYFQQLHQQEVGVEDVVVMYLEYQEDQVVEEVEDVYLIQQDQIQVVEQVEQEIHHQLVHHKEVVDQMDHQDFIQVEVEVEELLQ